MREKSRSSVCGQRAHQQRLAQPGHAFQQAMPADEQAGEHAVHDVVVPDDHAAELFENRLVAVGKLGGRFSIDSAMVMTKGSGVRVLGVKTRNSSETVYASAASADLVRVSVRSVNSEHYSFLSCGLSTPVFFAFSSRDV